MTIITLKFRMELHIVC